MQMITDDELNETQLIIVHYQKIAQYLIVQFKNIYSFSFSSNYFL